MHLANVTTMVILQDEQESAKLQIQSLIARNDELLTSLKVCYSILQKAMDHGLYCYTARWG